MTNKLYLTENGIQREMTLEEKEQFKKDIEEIKQRKIIEQQEQELKISAYKKLGLTDEEIAAII